MHSNNVIQDEEAERGVIGSLICQSVTTRLAEVQTVGLQAEHFYSEVHRNVFVLVAELVRDNGELDESAFLTLLQDVPGFGTRDARRRYLTDMQSVAPTSHNARWFADRVISAYHRREAARVLDEQRERLATPKVDVSAVIETTKKRLAGLNIAATPDGEPRLVPVLTCLADVEPRPVSWLWPKRIALRRISLLVGTPGVGKSFLTADMAARISTGTPWPDGESCVCGDVILLSAEDDVNETIRPRLDACLADVRRIHLLSAVRSRNKDGERERLVTLADVEAVEAVLKARPECKLVVVDPIGSYLGGRTDAHRDNEVRAVLAPIAALAERHSVAILIVAHRRKGNAGSADETALGSRAFTGIARAVWHLSLDDVNDSRRLLLSGKNNLNAVGDGLAFTIDGDPATIRWEPDAIAMSADDALAVEAATTRRGPKADTRTKAIDWLSKALADGPRLAEDLTNEWKRESGSSRTLQRAKAALGAESFHPTIDGPWWWRLPTKPATT